MGNCASPKPARKPVRPTFRPISFRLLELLNQLSPAHIRQLRQRYETHAAGRGLLKPALKEVLPYLKSLPDRLQDSIFRALDLDQDGVINFQELCVACAVGKVCDQTQLVVYLFSAIDLKRDKVVDLWELGTVLSTSFLVMNALHRNTMEDVKDAQSAVPQQGLSFAQFKPWAQKYLNLSETSQFLRIFSSPEEECTQFIKLFERHFDLIESETRFIVSVKWLQRWSKYANFDLKQLIPTCSGVMTEDGISPFPVDNRDIQDPQDEEQLKENVRLGVNCYALHSEIWEFLMELYSGGPAFPRKVTCIDGELKVDLFPVTVTLYRVHGDTYDKQKKTVVMVPVHWTLERIRGEVKWTEGCSLWLRNHSHWDRVSERLTLEECRAKSGKLRLLAIPFSSELIDFPSLEIIKSKNFHQIRPPGSASPVLKLSEILLTEDDTLREPRGFLPLSPDIPIQGVPNFNNTCYLNVILQILAYSPIGPYIRSQAFSRQIDSKSDYIVKELSKIFVDMTNKGERPDSEGIIVLLSVKAQGFGMDGVQRDSYECLNTLLELVHGEVKVGTQPNLIREMERPTAAQESDSFKSLYLSMRGPGSSLISDLFFNILKSEIFCERCDYRRVTLNTAFSVYLQLPVSNLVQLKVAVVGLNGHIMNVGVEIDLKSNVSHALDLIADLVSVPKAGIRLISFRERHVFTIFSSNTTIQDIVEAASGRLYAIECRPTHHPGPSPPPEPSTPDPKIERIVVKVIHFLPNSGKNAPFLALPSVITIPRVISYAELVTSLEIHAKAFQMNEENARFRLELKDFRDYRCCLCEKKECKGCELQGEAGVMMDWEALRRTAPVFVVNWKVNSCKITKSYHASYENIEEKLKLGMELTDCFRLSSESKSSEGQCEFCRGNYHTKESVVYTGDVLVVCLERFTRYQTRLYKNKQLIKFPVKGLDVGKNRVVYDLFGVVNHEGSASAGHNTCYCLTNTGQWVYFDDSKVMEVAGDIASRVVTSDAYILCYKRRELTGRSQVQLLI